VCCAAAHASLNVIVNEGLVERAAALHEKWIGLLQHPNIHCVKGIGMMMAVELKAHVPVLPFVNACYEAGIITDWFLFNDRAIRIAPPLIITEQQVDEACAILLRLLDQYP
jgi:4-aminobutyrate aminotransferase-like enzyme